jgi:hypothetical protein
VGRELAAPEGVGDARTHFRVGEKETAKVTEAEAEDRAH